MLDNNSKSNIENSTFTPPHPLKTAVLFLVFNRLDTTKQVFQAIREAKPPRLYIAADGARESKEGEAEKVKAVRDYILQNIDWDCEVKTLFREKNLGCKIAVSSAITWFFENEEMGIILEDDCLPSQSFFWFCEELLERYKDDMRVWHIGGASTIISDMIANKDAYYFSRFNHIWGWASWSNRWENYDINLTKFNDFIKQDIISNVTSDKLLKEFWINNFKAVKLKKIDTWDYQWYFTVWLNNGISILPTTNMISNIGFGVNATHTSDEDNKLSKMKNYEIELPCTNPHFFIVNNIFDKYNAKYLFGLTKTKIFISKIKQYIKKLLKG